MAVRATPVKLVFMLVMIALSCAWLSGCDKRPAGGGGAGTATIVALTGADIKADGALSDQGLKKIQDKSADSDVTVAFVRSKISDAALVQLAKFPNIHRIEAIGSTLTDPALAKLKTANSNVVVITK
jgi:fructose-1-phosphate kinase PfkB-like protein